MTQLTDWMNTGNACKVKTKMKANESSSKQRKLQMDRRKSYVCSLPCYKVIRIRKVLTWEPDDLSRVISPIPTLNRNSVSGDG